MNNLVVVENNEIRINGEFVEKYKNFKRLQLEMDLLEKELKVNLKEEMEKLGKTNLVVDGLSATIKKATTRKGVDTTRLKNELPDIYEEYLKETPVSSSITITVGD